VFFLFATDLATENGFTNDCYTDGRVPSVSPSVLFSPTDFIAVTDGRSPSVKLDNVVVTLKKYIPNTIRLIFNGFIVFNNFGITFILANFKKKLIIR
jgi:hypothetical protein